MHRSITYRLKRFQRRLSADESGQDFIEYALLGAFLVVIVYGVFPVVVGGPMRTIWERVSNVITTLTGA
jgi:Flp pilus assembly pilin Flp